MGVYYIFKERHVQSIYMETKERGKKEIEQVENVAHTSGSGLTYNHST
jgi:hypothetical protein